MSTYRTYEPNEIMFGYGLHNISPHIKSYSRIYRARLSKPRASTIAVHCNTEPLSYNCETIPTNRLISDSTVMKTSAECPQPKQVGPPESVTKKADLCKCPELAWYADNFIFF